MIPSSFKILVVDNDIQILDNLTSALRAEGFTVFSSSNSKSVVGIAKSELPHLILIDVLMPVMDGIEVCMDLRQIEDLSELIIVFYTEREEDYSQIAAFNAGADDYIIKPVRPRVLISRLKALLKRHITFSDISVRKQLAGLIIDRERYLIFRDGEEIVLPRKEFELLALLSTSPRKVFTRKEISQLIWGYEIFSKNRTIDVHIRKLREKIGDKYIKTIKGIGYSLET
ncbi:MAG: ArsR family transcriptional regulator [Bacteroidota bacterium]|jgi:two-component system alkaline phosphatase synthesis response regulator PhoP|nr:ArsR family transcriptional regulator [Bacteroidota bacterium]